MKLSGPSSPFNPCASPAAAAEPFAELQLSDRRIASKVEKLRTKGYFTIPVAKSTRRFLRAQSAAIPASADGPPCRDFSGSAFEQVATSMASRVVSRLKPCDLPLRPHEFQVRKPSADAASDWHQDRAPKVLTCITTLEGAGTQFVSPSVFNEKFAQVEDFPVTLAPVDGAQSIAKDVRTTRPGQFYFFADLGIDDPQVPKLVHRAPGEPGRSIFLARWVENKRAVRAPDQPRQMPESGESG